VCCCSIGIDDVMPREKLLAEKAKTLDKGYTNVQVRTWFQARYAVWVWL
jgi:hypothetical protein